MTRKLDGFVLLGAIDPPSVQVPARREARRHFTQLDQVTQLVGVSEADADVGFMARLLALCSLPRTNPGNRKEYIRRNGPYTLGMSAGINNKLPYGNLPRLLLAWVCTEAVRTQNREIILGRSLADFMRSVGVYDDSGAVRRRLRNQMQRLFRSHVELVYEDAHGSRFVNSAIADSGEFWWDPKHPEQPALWDSTIELSESFFRRSSRTSSRSTCSSSSASVGRHSVSTSTCGWSTRRSRSRAR